MYLLGIPDWLFWWGFVALMLALLLLAGNLCLTDDSSKEHFKCFFYSLSCFLPCLWCPLCCFHIVFEKTKCKLCGKELWDIIEHRKRCRERPAFGEIPDSSLYHCQKCKTHLKVWPVAKLESMDCVSLECFEKVTNNGENIHLCFICDKMVCDKHSTNPDQRINIDLFNPDTVSLIINDGASEDGSQNSSNSEDSGSGGFSDQRRSSIGDRSNFSPSDISVFPVYDQRRSSIRDRPNFSLSDPSVSPSAYDTSPPSAPPPSYNPMIRPYTSPTNGRTFEHPPNPHPTIGSNLTSFNTYNLPQNSEDIFPDLPPSYEVAMMDETDMC